jgi:DNA-binding CsgD family transcriptional regulator
MRTGPDSDLLLAEIAASAGSTSERARGMLEVLRQAVPFDGAWLALVDPLARGYHSMASADLDAPTVEFLSGPLTAQDIEVAGADRARPPFSPSDLPYPTEEIPTWADCLIPAGFHEALAVALFAPAGRHVGFLTLLSGGRQPPSPAVRHRLARLGPVLARGIDPMRSLRTTASLVRGATAGVALCVDGSCQVLPGLRGDPLLIPDSPVVAAARQRIGDGDIYSSFLWPLGGSHAPDGHVRVTVLAAPNDVPPALTAVALLSPATDLHGLTPRELEVLGLLVKGYSNQEIAGALVVAPRTVATHLEHVLSKLAVPTRTLAAVRAERDGLYVPPAPTDGRPLLSATAPAVGSGPQAARRQGPRADGVRRPRAPAVRHSHVRA